MKCPSCGSRKSLTIDSRPKPNFQWRRRECSKCSYRFTTHEMSIDLVADNSELEDLKLRLRNIVRVANGSFYQQTSVPGTPEDEPVVVKEP